MLAVEVQSRAESAVRQRIRDARFPEPKTLDTFDFNASEGVDAAQIADLARGRRRRRRTSSSPAPSAPGRRTSPSRSASIPRGSAGTSPFWRAADLVRALLEVRDGRELRRRRMNRVDLLILDELGFVPFDRTGGEWPKVFGGDEKLTTALLDRLAQNEMFRAARDRATRATTAEERAHEFLKLREQNAPRAARQVND